MALQYEVGGEVEWAGCVPHPQYQRCTGLECGQGFVSGVGTRACDALRDLRYF